MNENDLPDFTKPPLSITEKELLVRHSIFDSFHDSTTRVYLFASFTDAVGLPLLGEVQYEAIEENGVVFHDG